MNFIDTLKENLILVDNEIYPTLKLGDYFLLEEIKNKFFLALTRKDKRAFRNCILETIKLQTKKENRMPFHKAFQTMFAIFSKNSHDKEIAFLKPPPIDPTVTRRDKDETPDRLHYPGRYAAQWINILARTYGWTIEEIKRLDVNQALYLIQEIMINEHDRREWEYRLTEFAYKSEPGTNKSKYVPLPKPYWMRDDIDGNIKTTRLRRDMLPQGNVIDLSGLGVMADNEENIKPVQPEITVLYK